MAKFNVGDEVRPIPYSTLVDRGLDDACGSIYGIWAEAYKELCRGTELIVDTVCPIQTKDRFKYGIRVKYKCGDVKYFILPEWALEPAEPKLEVPKAPLFAPPESVNILGTEYRVEIVEKFDDDEDNLAGGFTNPDLHVIKLRDLTKLDEWSGESEEKVAVREKEIFRHEIVHAYLNESGLKVNAGVTGCSWAHNEEMVDWIAIQGPKIMETWKEAGCL